MAKALRRDRLILYAARDCTGCSLKAALSVLAYNIIRTINLVGAVTLRASLA